MLPLLLLACHTGKPSVPDDDSAPAPEEPDSGPVSTNEPFVLTACGADDEDARSLTLVPDGDGDGLADALFVGSIDGEAGKWQVGSAASLAYFWEADTSWTGEGQAPAVTLPDLDGDGVEDVFLSGTKGQGRFHLELDGTVTEWLDPPATILPWHDVDGDGRDDLVVADASEDPELVGLVLAGDADPTGFLVSTSVSDATLTQFGRFLALTTLDQDGDGFPELLASDDRSTRVLSSTALDRGELSTLTRFVTDLRPSPLGDVDGGGLEDFAFLGSWGEVCLAPGEAPEAVVCFAQYELGDTVVVGPDGAGGLTLWTAEDTEVRRWSAADALVGVATREARTNFGVTIRSLVADATSVWAVPTADDHAGFTEGAAVRLDPETLSSLVTIGGGGWGGSVDQWTLADRDGDGVLELLTTGDHLRAVVPEPGLTVSLCDLEDQGFPTWSRSTAIDDVDGDGRDDLAYLDDDGWLGLWSDAGGVLVSAEWNGLAYPIGCDLDGDGVEELNVGPFDARVTNPIWWIAEESLDRATLIEPSDDVHCLGDFDGDGVEEIGNEDGTDYVIYDGAEAGARRRERVARIEDTEDFQVDRALETGDFDGDGDMDVLLVGRDGPWRVVDVGDLTAADTAGAAVPGLDAGAAYQSPIGVEDLDGDGLPEVLYRVSDGDVLQVRAWSADGHDRLVWDYTTDAWDGTESVVAHDAFGVGRPGLVVQLGDLVMVPIGE